MSSERFSPARSLAADVLVRTWEEGAFASSAIDAALSRHRGAGPVDSRDIALATELVYGVLRVEAYLDNRLAVLASQTPYTKSEHVRAHLLVAAYAMAFLDRVPAFVAVSEAVSLVRALGDERAAGFSNAILRRLAGELESGPRPSLEKAVVESAPGWLRGSLRRAIGRSAAAHYLAAGPIPPPLGLSLAKDEDRDAWVERLRAAAPQATIEKGLFSPRAILVRGAGDVRRLPGADDAWIVQEEGAQLVALAVGARAQECVLDACSGRGNKSWILGSEVRPEGAVDAFDLFPEKLAKLRAGPAGRLVRSTQVIDWTHPPVATTLYDRAIVDAPCSGVGTLRRRPEIAHKRHADDVARLADLQTIITLNAAGWVRDGGTVVYAVCSVLHEEAEAVVDRLVAASTEALGLIPSPFEAEIVRGLASGGASLRLLPHVHGTDGYFMAHFVVRRDAAKLAT